MKKTRCDWSTFGNDPLMIRYHDKEWGVPVHNDRTLFEFLTLEGAQAGLSWQTILNNQENYRRAFDRFDPKKVATYDSKNIGCLLDDARTVRNRLKIRATVAKARKFIEIQKDFKSFNKYVWQFVDGSPINHRVKSLSEIPATASESDALSTDLQRRGFRFVGSKICYAFMQAIGMVNDHTTNCFRYGDLVQKSKR